MKAKFNPNQLSIFDYAEAVEAKRAIDEAARLQAEKEQEQEQAKTRVSVAEHRVMPAVEDDTEEMLDWYEENLSSQEVTEDELSGRNWYSAARAY